MEKIIKQFSMIIKITNIFRAKFIENPQSEMVNNEVSPNLSSESPTSFSHDEYLDCKEMLCPKPIFEISMKLNSMENDKVLRVECEDLAFGKDVEAWAKRTGNQILSLNFRDSVYATLIKKNC